MGRRALQVPAPFAYERATSVDHALALLEELGPEARLLAGGHCLLPMMKLRLAQPEHLIDIDPLADTLGYMTPAGAELRIGAMTVTGTCSSRRCSRTRSSPTPSG